MADIKLVRRCSHLQAHEIYVFAAQREEDRKKEGSKVIEVRRPGGGGPGRARGERSGRLSDRGLERVHDRGRQGLPLVHRPLQLPSDGKSDAMLDHACGAGNKPSPGPASSKPSENGGLASEVSADWDQPNAEEDKPVAAPTLPRYVFRLALLQLYVLLAVWFASGRNACCQDMLMWCCAEQPTRELPAPLQPQRQSHQSGCDRP